MKKRKKTVFYNFYINRSSSRSKQSPNKSRFLTEREKKERKNSDSDGEDTSSELLKIKSKEISILYTEIEKLKTKLTRLKSSKSFAKNEIIKFFQKIDAETKKNTINELKPNEKKHYFDATKYEIGKYDMFKPSFHMNTFHDMTIEKLNLMRNWILNEGKFELFKNDFELSIYSNVNSEEKYYKIIVKIINRSKSLFNEIDIKTENAKGKIN
jgi:hypothetical protein